MNQDQGDVQICTPSLAQAVVLRGLIKEFHGFKPGCRARVLFYLRSGVLHGDAHSTIQAWLDRWVHRLEQAGPGVRGKVLRALEEAGAA
jgi:hypothetical protein